MLFRETPIIKKEGTAWLAFSWRPEEVMGMWSEALAMLDRNIMQYMIDEQQEKLDELKKDRAEQDAMLGNKDAEIECLRAKWEKRNALDCFYEKKYYKLGK